jgi:hypothetical protein
VLQSPLGLGTLEGQEVTILLGRPGRINERATFFARGWLYGVSVAVVETHRRDELGRPWTLADVAAAKRLNDDEDLARHLAAADLVAVARVARVSEAQPPGKGRSPSSEHDPEWRSASLHVERTLAGDPPPGELAVLFPDSRDIHWFAVPKLKEGQEGIFLLHRGSGGGANEYTIVHAEDVLPVADLERVKTLLEKRKPSEGH